MTRCMLLLFAAAALTTASQGADPHVFGPRPDWARYRELGNIAVRAKLPDPANWAVEWPNGYAPLSWHHKGVFYGYLTCGVVRASEAVKGLYPRINFVAVIDHDQVQEIDLSHRESNSLVNIICAQLIDRGVLPPASMMETSATALANALLTARTAATSDTVASLGLTVRAMPEGAYVVAVEPGSPASIAKLVPGTVITRVNGIAMAGLGDASVQVLAADQPSLAIETAAGERLALRPAPVPSGKR